MKVTSMEVSQLYLNDGMQFRLKLDSLSSKEMEDLRTLAELISISKGDIIGSASIVLGTSRGLLIMNIFSK